MNDYKPFRFLKAVYYLQRLAIDLDDLHSEILDLYVVHGRSVESICSILDITEEQCKNKLYTNINQFLTNYCLGYNADYIDSFNRSIIVTIDDLREWFKPSDYFESFEVQRKQREEEIKDIIQQVKSYIDSLEI